MARSPKDIGNVEKDVLQATSRSRRETAEGQVDDAIAGDAAYRQARGYETRGIALSARRLQQIAEALDVPVSDFFIQAKEPHRSNDASLSALEVAALFERLAPAEKDVIARLLKALAQRSGVEPT